MSSTSSNKFNQMNNKSKAIFLIGIISISILVVGGVNYAINNYRANQINMNTDTTTTNSDIYINTDTNTDTNTNEDNYDDDNGNLKDLLFPIERCKIEFIVQIPSNTPASDLIYMRTDIGTGLIESEIELTQSSSPEIWKTSLEIPKGKIFRYRYSRNMDWDKEESYIPRDGLGFHYRTIAVMNNMTIEDHILKWEDLPIPDNNQLGNITGTVIDSNTKEPIMNLWVSAGPYQTITKYNGYFSIKGIPTGNITLSIFSENGQYKSISEKFEVLINETTNISLEIERVQLRTIVFNVSVPTSTPDLAQIKVFGSISKMGSFKIYDGTAIDVSRIPFMTIDNSYSPNSGVINDYIGNFWTYEIKIGEGFYIQYLYTFGDIFYNREYNTDGNIFDRELYIPTLSELPGDKLIVNDSVESWKNDNMVEIEFGVESPTNEPVSITSDIWGGWEPIQMWALNVSQVLNNEIKQMSWSYTLYLPKNTDFYYRYLRYSDPKTGLERFSPDTADTYRYFNTGLLPKTINDTIIAWRYQMHENISNNPNIETLPNPVARESNKSFQGGVELVDYYNPEWNSLINSTMDTIASTNVSWVQIPSVWGILSETPVIIDYGWNSIPYDELIQHIHAAKNNGLNVSIRPFAYQSDNNFQGFVNKHSFLWYDEFFEELNQCFLYHAKIAEDEGVEMLILPNFNWADDSNSTIIKYIDGKWNETISNIRSIFSGELTIDYYVDRTDYNWYANLDYLGDKWWTPIATNTTATIEELKTAVLDKWNNYYAPIISKFNKTIIFSEIAYYSANSSAMQNFNVYSSEISEFGPANESILSNWSQQALAYEAVLNTFASISWVQGAYSFAYFYYPMDCKGYSIRDKTAEYTISNIYGSFN